jgi:hypothetical protein
MVGYGCGILTSQYGSGTVSSAVSGSFGIWRAPFIVQGLVVLPVALCILLIPDEFLQRPPTSDALALEGDSAAATFASSSPSASPTAAATTGTADLSPALKPITPVLAATSASADSPNTIAMAGGAAPSSPGTMLRQRSTSVVVNGLEVKKVLRPTIDQTAMHVDKHVPADRTLYDQVLLLLRNHVFVYTVLGLTALFFVVTGIQFWVTPYLVLDLEQPVGYVGLAFIFASATGPTCGVLFGGYIVDRNGGYKGTQQTAIALRICLVFVAIAVSCCILCIFAKTLLLVIAFIWLTLFFGGALVPPATGILMSCVPGKMRNFASACAQMVYNLFGYCLSPLLSGAAMEATGSRAWGFRVVMLWSGFGAIFVFLAWRAAVKKATFPRRTTGGGVRSPPKAAAPASSSSSSSSSPAQVGILMPPLQPLSLDAAKPTVSAQQQEEVVTADAAEEGEFGPYPDGSYVAPASEAPEEADVDASAYADEFDDEFDVEDDFPNHTAHDVKIQMIYHRGARHSSIADFSALLPAWLQAKASGRSNDQFADQDLIMENNGVVKSV